jgi:hypothetical protein
MRKTHRKTLNQRSPLKRTPDSLPASNIFPSHLVVSEATANKKLSGSIQEALLPNQVTLLSILRAPEVKLPPVIVALMKEYQVEI